MMPAATSRVRVEGEDFLIAMDDLAALAEGLGARANALSVIPAGDAGGRATQVVAALRELPAADQMRLAVAVGVLRAPAKMAHWHQSVADESVTRAALAWSGSAPEAVVALAGIVDPRRISFWTPASLRASIGKTLAAVPGLSDDGIGCKVSTAAVVVFLAILDQLRASRLHGMLTHAAPAASFCQAELQERLRDAISEDFRWPLLFVEKLIPGRMVPSLTQQEVGAALGELVRAGLVESASGGAVPRFELTAEGRVIADGVLHEVSKVALGVTDQQGARLGRDILLLVRGTFHLFLFAMAGQDGAIAAVTQDEMAAALHLALRPIPPVEVAPAPEPAQAPPPPPPLPQPAAWYVVRGGQTEGPVEEAALRAMLAALPPETLVWNEGLTRWMSALEAGLVAAPVADVCVKCGTARKPDRRYCPNCGHPQW